MKTAKFQLKNGLSVLLAPSHKSPVVSVQMWVRNGSADELKGEEGISHFIEHLLFKGSRKYQVGEIAKIIEGSGGELNAYTSFDQTVFYVTLSKEDLSTGLDVICEMMGFPTFDEQEVHNEREVVVEEIKRGHDSLGRRASQLLFSTNYKKHPYGVPVIGYEKNVRRWPAKKIKEFYAGRYSPKNMFLMVSGDFDLAKTKKEVEKMYSQLVPTKVRKIKHRPEPKQSTPRLSVEVSKFQQSIGYLSWKIPGVKHKDIPALDVLCAILGQGDSSRLVQRLRIDEAVVNSVGAGTFSPQDQGLMTISYGGTAANIEKANALIFEQILHFIKEGASEDEIKRAILNLESDDFYGAETVDGISRKYGSLEFYFKDLKYIDRYFKLAKACNGAQLAKVAKKYFDPKTFCLSIVTNEKNPALKKSIQNQIKKFSADFKKTKVAAKKSGKIKFAGFKGSINTQKNAQPKTREVQLENGVKVLLRPLPETQVVNLRAASLGGLVAEPAGQEGLSELLRRTWSCGTKNKSERDLNLEIESIASGLSTVAGRNTIGMSMDFLSQFSGKALDIFTDVLINPSFASDAVEREKTIQLENIKTRNDNPAQICGRLFMKEMFSSHVYGRDMLGDANTVGSFKSEQLTQLFKNQLVPENLTISVVGGFDEKSVLKNLENSLGAWRSKNNSHQFLKPENLTKDRMVYEKSEKEQSHFMMGYRGIAINDSRKYVSHVVESILSGQGGRLFLELRDKNSLAYSVSPMRMEGVETGYFGAYIGCSPDKVKKAQEMMKHEFQRLQTEKVSDHELERSIRYLIGRHDIDLQRSSAISASILYDRVYNLPGDETFKAAENYRRVTAKDIQDFAKELFSQNTVTALVGPTNPWA